MNQRKLLTDKQLERLKELGFTKKELESLATIKTKNFYLRNTNDGEVLRLHENGKIADE